MKGRTGAPMNYAGRAKTDKVKSDCSMCIHRRSKGSIKYCSYYDIFSPDRKACARYAPRPGKSK